MDTSHSIQVSPPDQTIIDHSPSAQPDSVRDEIARLLRLAARASSPAVAARHITSARSLAETYATAWADSFPVRQVERFANATPVQRRNVADADSLRREARIVVGQRGVGAAMQLWRESLRLTTAAGDSAGRAASLASIGAGHYMAGNFDSAVHYLERARTLATALADHRTVGNVLGNLANISKDRGDLATATQLYEQASIVRRRSGDSRGIAADQNNLGLIARALGDMDGARKAFEEALALNRSEGRHRLVAINLTNLGDIAAIDGDYAAAHEYYTSALELNQAAGDAAEEGFVLHSLGLLAVRRGDYRRALEVLVQALRVHEESGAVVEALAVGGSVAAVQAAVGDYEAAYSTLERARSAEGALGVPGVQGRLALARGDLFLQLGAFANAEAEYARAEHLFQQAQDAGGRAAAQEGRAVLHMLRDDYTGALRLLELAMRAHEAGRDVRSAALTRLQEGDVRRRQGEAVAARRALNSAYDTFTALGEERGRAAALLELGELELNAGAVLAAEAFYRRGLEVIADLPTVELRWRLHAGMGRALRGRGAVEPAAEQLRASVAALEGAAAGLQAGDRRAGFLLDKWEPYAELALLESRRDRAAETFAISERMRSGQSIAMLGRGRIASGRRSSEREQDLRRRIGELMSEVEGVESGRERLREPALGNRSSDAAREALAATQREYAELLRELRVTEPRYARLVAPTRIGWREVARHLASDMVLLQYMVADSGSIVTVVTGDTVAAIDLDIRRAELANLIDFARGVMERPGSHGTQPLWRTPLRRLYHHLIEPVERAGYLRGRRALVIVPHAELHFLPFGALLLSDPADRFLVERFQLSYAPSAGAWVRLGNVVADRRGARVLALAPHIARLPASRDEVAGIRAVYGRRTTTLFGSAANKGALLALAPRHDVLHFATYGVLNKHNPLFSYVDLSSSDDEDGRLEVHEVFDLQLIGQLVVLSACQTGLAAGAFSDVPAGDEWVGLMHGFLQAGAGGVLGTLWRVEDRTTARLMQQFYRNLRSGQGDAAALAMAQRELLRDSTTAHPFYWAGFIMSGARTQRARTGSERGR